MNANDKPKEGFLFERKLLFVDLFVYVANAWVSYERKEAYPMEKDLQCQSCGKDL